ncbi:hypothetical protein HMPREF0973_00254 [Prevotella veroralis F0319]|uniref:Uncharacterized protein n=1 Tax=Prevotella veroralis F0319 TaxID=649761 RepID=C9MKX9_9BACT|nr:hypothetical protein HMPREF0973_00254 [Prevotella veroralis F0319]
MVNDREDSIEVILSELPHKLIPRGCVKIATHSFLCTKPRLSQARALLFPKVFVPLGIQKISL